jgi:hypothetical protein
METDNPLIQRRVTFVVATNNQEVLQKNFLASPCLRNPDAQQILQQKGFPSAASAYNDAIDRSENDLIVFCHQDVIFPEPWLAQLEKALQYLESADPNWGVLGCYGETRDHRARGYIYSCGLGKMGRSFEHPAQVQTLDEVVLIIRKSSGLRFDEALPHFHLYGADICMAAERRSLKSYAVPAFCIHNTRQILVLPQEFYDCYRYFKKKWKDFLPIQTTCLRITRFDFPMHSRRLWETYLRYIRHKEVGATRRESVHELLEQLDSAGTHPRDERIHLTPSNCED